MERPELSQIEAFIQVAECGSFSAAARQLGVPKSSVSRRVAALEETLGLTLVRRTTRHTSLTDEGAAYRREVAAAIAQLQQAHALVQQLRDEPGGTIRLTVPTESAQGVLGELFAEFSRLHPRLVLEIEATNRIVDLVTEGFDLGVRGGTPKSSSLKIRKLGSSPIKLMASPAYLAQYGTPKTIHELSRHRAVATSSRGPARWSLAQDGRKHSVVLPAPVAVNDLRIARDAAVAGLGIVLLPEFIGMEQLAAGDLVEVLPGYGGAPSCFFLVYPPGPPPRVRLLLDFLTERLGTARAK